ncbi:MAG: helix-turn-helix domain-containing protein [Anaerolineales bacterium]|nr:helix-turn-helix domain-containing protein [Anaerolineales bacterium]MCX7756268.1 helix-turn-helix domain-containing protein [Anaerolineales bacterium]MDW8276651.1 helix-turn-helix domain-containing protein [Anaerolineales bacterium]
MSLKNFAVINHPVRMRIFQALHAEELSINQLAKRLADVPKPSLYRHIHQMVEAGVVEVTRTRLVNGIEERFFASVKELIDSADIDRPGGLEQFADHVQLYGNGVVQDLTRYILSSGDPYDEKIAARDHLFYATEQEFVQARETMYALLKQLEAASPAPGRRKYRVFIMGHPVGGVDEEP